MAHTLDEILRPEFMDEVGLLAELDCMVGDGELAAGAMLDAVNRLIAERNHLLNRLLNRGL